MTSAMQLVVAAASFLRLLPVDTLGAIGIAVLLLCVLMWIVTRNSCSSI